MSRFFWLLMALVALALDGALIGYSNQCILSTRDVMVCPSGRDPVTIAALYRGFLMVSLIAGLFLVFAIGWILSFRVMKRRMDEKRPWLAVLSWLLVVLLVACPVIAVVGYAIPFFLADAGVFPECYCSSEPLSFVLRDLLFIRLSGNAPVGHAAAWFIPLFCPIMTILYLVDIRTVVLPPWLRLRSLLSWYGQRRASAPASLPERIRAFNERGAIHYWAITGLCVSCWLLVTVAIQTRSFPRGLATGEDLRQIVIYAALYSLLQVVLLGMMLVAVLAISRFRLVSKESHRAERILVLVAPFIFVLLTDFVLMNLLSTFLGLQHIGDGFTELVLRIVESAPLGLIGPLIWTYFATPRGGMPRRFSVQEFRRSIIRAYLFFFYVIRSHQILFAASVIVSAFILFYGPLNPGMSGWEDRLGIVAGATAGWLFPLLYALVAYEDTCFKAYTYYLRLSLRGLHDHLVVGGYGDFGQRVTNGIVEDLFLNDPWGCRTTMDGVDIILPDGNLGKVLTSLVVLDANRDRFEYLTSLENGLQAGLAFVTILPGHGAGTSGSGGGADPDSRGKAVVVYVPAVVGPIEHREVTTTVAIENASFFASLVRDSHSAPMIIERIREIWKEAERRSKEFRPNGVRVPLCVVSVPNLAQFQGLTDLVRRNGLPIHVLFPTFLEAVHFSARLVAMYRKFVSCFERIPRILLVGQGFHLGFVVDSFLRSLTRKEVDDFRQGHSISPRIALLTGHGVYHDRRRADVGRKATARYRLVRREVIPLNGLVTSDPDRTVVGVDTTIVLYPYEPRDFDSAHEVLKDFGPDIIGFVDYDYAVQYASIWAVLTTARRLADRDRPVSGVLPLPDVLVCRESGPDPGGLRDLVDRKLLDYVNHIQKRRAEMERVRVGSEVMRKVNDYYKRFPSTRMVEERHTDPSSRVEENNASSADHTSGIVVDVLGECVSRVLSIACTQTVLPREDAMLGIQEFNVCLPDAPGQLAGVWEAIALDRPTLDVPRPDERYVTFNLIHIDTHESMVFSRSPERRYCARSYIHLSDGPLKKNDPATCLQLNLFSIKRDPTREESRPELFRWGPECSCAAKCCNTLYCGLTAMSSGTEADTRSIAVPCFHHEVDGNTPFAYLEFIGPDRAGAGMEAVNLLAKGHKPDPGPISFDTRFTADYQCHDESRAWTVLLGVPKDFARPEPRAGLAHVEPTPPFWLVGLWPIVDQDGKWRTYLETVKEKLDWEARICTLSEYDDREYSEDRVQVPPRWRHCGEALIMIVSDRRK